MYLSKRNGIYYVFYRQPNGKKTCKSTKKTKKKDAFRYLTTFKKHLEEQKDGPKFTLSEYETLFLRRTDHAKTMKSLKHDKASFRHFRNFLGKDMPIREITVPIVHDFVGTTFAKSKHVSTLYHRHLKAAFNRAVEWEYLDQNPFNKVKVPRIPKNDPIFISKDEFDLIVSKEPRDIFKLTFELAFYTGMRLSEITHLDWGQVNLNEKYVEVLNTDLFTTKSKRSRKIYLTDYLIERLEIFRLQNNKGYVFQKYYGERYSGTYVSKSFKRALRQTDLNQKIHFHTLRHSFASNLVQRGANLYSIKELMGHSSISVTEQYSHLNNESLQKTIQLLD